MTATRSVDFRGRALAGFQAKWLVLKNEVAGFELWRTTSMLVLFGFVFIGPTFCADFLHMLLKMLLGAQIDLKHGFGCHCGLAGSTEIRD